MELLSLEENSKSKKKMTKRDKIKKKLLKRRLPDYLDTTWK